MFNDLSHTGAVSERVLGQVSGKKKHVPKLQTIWKFFKLCVKGSSGRLK